MRYRVLAIAALVAGCGLAAHAQPATNSPTAPTAAAPGVLNEHAIRDAAAKRFESLDRTPGAVVAVKRGDAAPIVFALGHIDAEKTAPMTADRPLRIASVTKPLLGTLVLKLADEGRLSLDDPVSKYVEGLPAGSEAITLRMLGNNTSGVFNSIGDPKFRDAIAADPGHEWTAAEILGYALKHDLAFKPGEKWSYSNTNAVLLGEVVRKVTGKPWGEVMRERVLDPLTLTHTGVGTPSSGAGSPGLPKGYRYAKPGGPVNYGNEWIDASAFSASWANAAGDMYSTAGDLALAAEPILTGKLLSEKSRAEYFKWVDTGHKSSPGPNSDPATYFYGFCVGKRAIGKASWIGHIGDVPGYSSFMVYEPQSRTTVVVLSNLSNTVLRMLPAEEIGEAVIAAISAP